MNTFFQSIQHEAYPSSMQAETKFLMHVVLDQSECCLVANFPSMAVVCGLNLFASCSYANPVSKGEGSSTECAHNKGRNSSSCAASQMFFNNRTNAVSTTTMRTI
jgi:hypothetical protein